METNKITHYHFDLLLTTSQEIHVLTKIHFEKAYNLFSFKLTAPLKINGAFADDELLDVETFPEKEEITFKCREKKHLIELLFSLPLKKHVLEKEWYPAPLTPTNFSFSLALHVEENGLKVAIPPLEGILTECDTPYKGEAQILPLLISSTLTFKKWTHLKKSLLVYFVSPLTSGALSFFEETSLQLLKLIGDFLKGDMAQLFSVAIVKGEECEKKGPVLFLGKELIRHSYETEKDHPLILPLLEEWLSKSWAFENETFKKAVCHYLKSKILSQIFSGALRELYFFAPLHFELEGQGIQEIGLFDEDEKNILLFLWRTEQWVSQQQGTEEAITLLLKEIQTAHKGHPISPKLLKKEWERRQWPLSMEL